MRPLAALLLVACTDPAPTPRADPAPAATFAAPRASVGVGEGVGAAVAIPPVPYSPPAPARPARVLPPGARVLRPTPVVALSAGTVAPVFDVVVDDAQAYYSDGLGFVWAQAKDGSSPARALWNGRLGHAMSIVLDGNDVVFGVTPLGHRGGRAKIVRVPKTGGGAGTWTTITEAPEDVISLVSDGTSLYFSLFDGSPLRKAPLAGGASEIVRSPGIKNGALAVDARWLYVADYERGVVVRASKTPGGGETVLARGQPKPVGIAIDGAFVYFPCEGDGTIRRVPKNGGAIETIARGQINHDLLALDATYVYWASWDQKHTLKRTRKDGSQPAPDVLLTDLHDPEGVATDSKYVYVANKSAGEVLALPK